MCRVLSSVGFGTTARPVASRTTVTLPLSGFTDYWDDATGEAIKTCQENKIY